MKIIFIKYFILLEIFFFCTQINAQESSLQNYTKYFSGITENPSKQDIQLKILHKTLVDTLYSFSTPGSFPLGLAWDGQYFWNCDSDSQKIYKLTPTGVLASYFPYPQNSNLCDITWDGNYLWFSDEQAATLYKIDPNTGLPIGQFNLPSFGDPDPNGWGLAWDGQYLWHSEYGDSARIYKLNPQNAEVVSSFAPLSHSLLGITWADGYLYGVGIGEGLIYKFDPSTGVVLDSTYWEIPYPLGLVWDGQYFWNVSSAIMFGGKQRIYQISSPITSITESSVTSPIDFGLSQNYPNPFNPLTTIDYQILQSSNVKITIYDITGRLVKELMNEQKNNGKYSIVWNGKDNFENSVPSGTYFYQIQAGDFVQAKKMILLK